MQGDVLARAPALEAVLEEVHPHFFKEMEKNLFFMVLTQSCDLVRRDDGPCKARYITLAPVRTLDLVLKRQLNEAESIAVNAKLPVFAARTKNRATEFLRRLFNNNEPGYFFLDAADTSLGTDCVAFLGLSIAIKSELHFDSCLAAKVLQLDSTFQAKLGWLVGQIYSRVGTQDWDVTSLASKVTRVLDEAAIWVDDAKVKGLETEYAALALGRDDAEMSEEEIARLVGRIPSKRQLLLKEAKRVIDAALSLEPALADKVFRRLEGDARLSTYLK